MDTLTHFPLELEADAATGEAIIGQRLGPHPQDRISIRIHRDQAIQVAEFLLTSFKVKKSERVSGSDEGFDEFWKLYPVKEAKDRCLMYWKRDNCAAHVDRILEDVKNRKSSESWVKGYVPFPQKYLNEKRYMRDDAPTSLWEDSL